MNACEKVCIDSREMRHKVTLQRASSSTGTLGQSTRTWSNLADTWAKIETLGGREAEQARKTFADAKMKITIRYYSGLTSEDRVKFGSRVFPIGLVDNVEERNIKMILYCSEER